MKKLLALSITLALFASLFFSGVVLAADPLPEKEEGVVAITMDGEDCQFEVWTQIADAQDVFRGKSDSTLSMSQIIRYQPSGQWTSDAPDIDRYGSFNGDGSLQTESSYASTKSWWNGASYTEYYVESDTHGFIGQNLHFDGYFGGVRDVDPWKKQRNAEIYAEGNYHMSLTSIDQFNSPSDYGFSFEATDNTGWGNLFLDTMETASGHNSPDKLITDFVYTYDGNPGVSVDWLANTGGDINMSIDLINKYISGDGILW